MVQQSASIDLDTKEIIGILHDLQTKFKTEVLGVPEVRPIEEFVKDFLQKLDEISDSKFIVAKQLETIQRIGVNVSDGANFFIRAKQTLGDSDETMSKRRKLKSSINESFNELLTAFEDSRSQLRQSASELFSTITGKKPEIEEAENYDLLIPLYYDRTTEEIDKLKKLRIEISQGEVSEEFLYWEPRAAKRWQELCDKSSRYSLHRISRDIIETHIDEMIDKMEKDSGNKIFDFVNLGTGGGYKDHRILDSLLNRITDYNTKMHYIPIDFSITMLQASVSYVLEHLTETQKRKLKVRPILGDFLQMKRYQDIIWETNRPKIYGCLGNTFGNFVEDTLITPFRECMHENDFLILGVDLLGGRTDEQLMEAYNDELVRKLVVYPILEYIPHEERDRLTVSEMVQNPLQLSVKEEHGSVLGSKTVLTSVKIGQKNIKHFYSAKYDLNKLIVHLEKNFTVLSHYTDSNKRYAKLVLKKKR